MSDQSSPRKARGSKKTKADLEAELATAQGELAAARAAREAAAAELASERAALEDARARLTETQMQLQAAQAAAGEQARLLASARDTVSDLREALTQAKRELERQREDDLPTAPPPISADVAALLAKVKGRVRTLEMWGSSVIPPRPDRFGVLARTAESEIDRIAAELEKLRGQA